LDNRCRTVLTGNEVGHAFGPMVSVLRSVVSYYYTGMLFTGTLSTF
jgi:hypothetical protein